MNNIKVGICKCNRYYIPSVIYKTIILKPNCCCNKNVLTQDMLNEENVKYVIKYNFNLDEEHITVPENCILEFDGGSLKNGTIVGQDTFYSDEGGLGDEVIFGDGIIKEGTWRKNEGGGSIEQIQSDWNQTNTQAKDYIKNKPNIPSEYIKNASVSVDGNTLTLTKKDETTVTFTPDSGGGSPDKPYDPEAHSGLGRKTLELKGDSNILMQEDFDQDNTIYVVAYDFVLGEDITVPANCVLNFDGGSISNTESNEFVLSGTGTQIRADKTAIFTNMKIGGTWNVPDITSAWFSDAEQDNVSRQLFNLTDGSVFNTVTFEAGIFNVSTSSDNEAVFHVKSNTKVILSGDIQLAVNAFSNYYIFDINGASNVEIVGGGSISGDYTGNPEEPGHTGAYGHGHGIRITNGSEAVSINNLSISNCAGDAIYIGRKTNSGLPVSQKISIERCKLYDCARQGISVCHAVNVNISGCEIYNIKKEKPSSGIDIEPNVGDTCRNIVITHNDIHECFHGITTNYNNATGINIYDVNIASNKIEGTLKSGMSIQEVENISIYNNYISTTSELLNYEDTVFTIRGKSNLRNCAIFGNEIVNTKEGYVDDGTRKNIAAVLILGSKGCKIFSNTITAASIPALALVGHNLSLENNVVTSPYIFSPLWDVDTRLIVGNNFEGYCDMSVRYGCLISGNIFNPATGINGGDNLFTSALNLLKIYGENYTFANNDVRIPMQTTCDLSSSVNSIIGNVFDIDVEGVYGSDARIIVIKNALFENNRVYIKSLNKGVDPGNITVINGTGRGTYKRNTFANLLSSEENPVTLGRCMQATTTNTMIEICSNRVTGNFTSVYPSNVRYYNLLHDNKKNIGTTLVRTLITEGLTEDDAGHMYFDTDLGKPIYWNGLSWIDSSGQNVTWPITYSLTNLTASNYKQPDAGVQYTTVLTADTGYTLPSAIEVKMGSTTMSVGTDYTYNASTGEVTILGTGGEGGVTEYINITATAI